LTQEYYEGNLPSRLKLPPQSPDLNLIENCWSYLRDELYQKNTILKTKHDVLKEANEIWFGMMQNLLPKLYNSMHSRLQAVIDKEGKRINY